MKNEEIYDISNIPRIDNFIIKLTRDYFSKIPQINNILLKTHIHRDIPTSK